MEDKKAICISLNNKIWVLAKQQAEELGLSFSAYLTFLIVSDVKNEANNK